MNDMIPRPSRLLICLLPLGLLLLTAWASATDTIISPPDSLLSTAGPTTTALSLSVDDIIAQSTQHEAQLRSRSTRPARPKPSSSDQSRSPYPKGGSMNQLLNWAIEHSDADALEGQAEKIKAMSVEERKAAFESKFSKEALEAIFGSESNRMSVSIGILANATVNKTVPDDQIVEALQELQEHVEDFDKANDLHTMGGMAPLQALLQARQDHPEITQWALYTVGTAAAHNPKVQNQLLQHDVLKHILDLLKPTTPHLVIAKGLYAASAICGNFPEAVQALFEAGGPATLDQLADTPNPRIQLKWMTLAHDLAEVHPGWSSWLGAWLAAHPRSLGVVLGNTDSLQDLQDKVVQLVQGVAQRGMEQQDLDTLAGNFKPYLETYLARHSDTETEEDIVQRVSSVKELILTLETSSRPTATPDL